MGHLSARNPGTQSRRAVLIAGPTASGKSALALDIAKRIHGLIINADSMQVYRDLRVLTARPTSDEEAEVPHRLYGHVDAAEDYSVGRWLGDVGPVLDEANSGARVPIFVGGTGLYFKGLTRGLATIPPVPARIRLRLRERLAHEGPAALHGELARFDPEMGARLRPGDGVRIVRALEVLEATGRSLWAWQRDRTVALIEPQSAVCVFLAVDRGELRHRIDARFDAMMAGGALEEVRALAVRGLDPLKPIVKAHGVPWLIRAAEGQISMADAAREAKADTWRYTKRQLTWFRNQLPEWPWLGPAEATATILEPFRVAGA